MTGWQALLIVRGSSVKTITTVVQDAEHVTITMI